MSSGTRIHPLVLLGLEPKPQNLSHTIDCEGIGALTTAAKDHGVKRMIMVTTASAGTPWSAPAVFLNSVCYMSVKWKFAGEQRLRQSGLDYIIIRPFGLLDTPQGVPTGLGIETEQGRTSGSRRRIPREDVASLCREALRARPGGGRVTFECWATDQHRHRVDWDALVPDLSPLPEVNHDVAVATGLAGLGLGLSVAGFGAVRGSRALLRVLLR